MDFQELWDRRCPPEPWAEDTGIPWNEPGFSERMLAEHLSQDHDLASRRTETIDRHVAWLHEALPSNRGSRVLDLGCGPGFYLQRLAALGHDCEGIDFSPASVDHARKAALRENLPIRYRQEDLRRAEFGTGFDLVMMIWGEFNTFPPAVAADLLRRASAALGEGGRLLLELSSFDAIRDLGHSAPAWHSADSGLFGESPYLCLEENHWSEEQRVATKRYFIVDAASSRVSAHTASYRAYRDDEIRRLMHDAGLTQVTRYDSLAGDSAAGSSELVVYLAGR